jgi:hypothetical protein
MRPRSSASYLAFLDGYVSTVLILAAVSLGQVVQVAVMSTLMPLGCIGNMLVGGWSIGANGASHASVAFEATIAAPAGMFLIDPRGLPPMPFITASMETNPVCDSELFRLQQAGTAKARLQLLAS